MQIPNVYQCSNASAVQRQCTAGCDGHETHVHQATKSAVKVIPLQPGAFAAGGPAQQHVPAPAPAPSSPPQQHTHLLPLLVPVQRPLCLGMLAARPPGLATAGNCETA